MYIYQSYREIKTGVAFWTTLYVPVFEIGTQGHSLCNQLQATKGSISPCNIAGLISNVSEEVATQIAKNCRRRSRAFFKRILLVGQTYDIDLCSELELEYGGLDRDLKGRSA